MLAKERCDRIYAMIQEQGAVTTAKLVELFGVSTETIRKDLLFLERQGLLSKVHGGAVSKGDMRPFLELPERSKKQTPQKKELSLRAADFITDGDIIGIDSGSTAVMLAEVIRERFSVLTVITYSYDVFEILQRQPGFSVILCGGCYLPSENAFCGALTLDMLSRLHMQKAFLCPSAISLEYGICDYQKDLYQIQRQLMKSADDIYILADSSKFEKKALLKLDDTKSEYHYVTDGDLSEELKQLYTENHITVYS